MNNNNIHTLFVAGRLWVYRLNFKQNIAAGYVFERLQENWYVHPYS